MARRRIRQCCLLLSGTLILERLVDQELLGSPHIMNAMLVFALTTERVKD